MKRVCQIFDLPSTDNVCVNLDEQTWYTLEAALIRRYPIGEATFSQIMNELEITSTDFSQDPKTYSTFDTIAATFSGFAGANCPGTEVYTNSYTCHIYFKEDIRPIAVWFENSTDLVLAIRVGRTGS